MPIAVVYRFPAMTAEQYRDSWAAGPPVDPPRGLILHAAVGEGEAFFTMRLWEDREAYEAFAPRFADTMKTLGFLFGQPTILRVQNLLRPSP